MNYDEKDVLDVIEYLIYTSKNRIYKGSFYIIYAEHLSKDVFDFFLETTDKRKSLKVSIKLMLENDISLSDEELKHWEFTDVYIKCIKEIRRLYNIYKCSSPAKYFL